MENILQVFCGRLEQANVIDHQGQVFSRMKELPWHLVVPHIYQWVYLLGVFDYRGDVIVKVENGIPIAKDKKRTPSLFAITNHESTHPDLGSITELKELIQTIQEAGGKVMVDYVANHTGTNHPWVTKFPEYYKKTNGVLIKQFSQDVYPLDYQNPDLREKMSQVIQTIASWGVDGLRCDMAHLVSLDYWQRAIYQTKQKKADFFFLAEAYSESVFNWKPINGLIAVGFDSVYEEFFNRNLKEILSEGKPWQNLEGHLNFLLQHHPEKYTHYLANHDDPPVRQSLPIQEALLLLLMALGGKVLIPQGQLMGYDRRIPHHTVEVLPKEYGRIETVPRWFEQLVKAVESLQPKATHFKLQAESLAQVKLETALGRGLAWLNLSSQPQKIDSQNYLNYKPWSKLKGQNIPAGGYELLIEDRYEE